MRHGHCFQPSNLRCLSSLSWNQRTDPPFLAQSDVQILLSGQGIAPSRNEGRGRRNGAVSTPNLRRVRQAEALTLERFSVPERAYCGPTSTLPLYPSRSQRHIEWQPTVRAFVAQERFGDRDLIWIRAFLTSSDIPNLFAERMRAISFCLSRFFRVLIRFRGDPQRCVTI